MRVDVCVKLWFEVRRWEKKILHRRPDYNTDKVRSFAGGMIESPPLPQATFIYKP